MRFFAQLALHFSNLFGQILQVDRGYALEANEVLAAKAKIAWAQQRRLLVVGCIQKLPANGTHFELALQVESVLLLVFLGRRVAGHRRAACLSLFVGAAVPRELQTIGPHFW